VPGDRELEKRRWEVGVDVVSFVSVRALNKTYTVGQQRIHVLRDLDLDVRQGEMVAIVGASGVGKSTLLHLLGGLDRPDSGTVVVGDHDLAAMGNTALVEFRNRNVGFVFQFHHLLAEFDARENVEMPMRIARLPQSESRTRARDLLTRDGLAERLVHKPSMLSGGEQQRVAVARALVMKPALLLADEPTGDLDEPTAATLHALLREMHAEHGLTSIIATHNLQLAASCDRVLRLEHGQLAAA
jgi:lipoprotein-releasing system ATP-binding protein